MQFLILDDLTEATNIDMVEGRKEKTTKVCNNGNQNAGRVPKPFP